MGPQLPRLQTVIASNMRVQFTTDLEVLGVAYIHLERILIVIGRNQASDGLDRMTGCLHGERPYSVQRRVLFGDAVQYKAL